MSKQSTQSALILGEFSNVVGQQGDADRGATHQITTRGGLRLALIVMADGTTGPGKGDHAAQIARQAFLSAVIASDEGKIPRLLTQAFQAANQAVWTEARTATGKALMSASLAVAAVNVESRTLYIAHVGNSAIYLCRGEKLSRLNVDHTLSKLISLRVDLTPTDARATQPEALIRAIGLRDRVAADIGFYIGATDSEVATARGMNGLPLQPGDSVLVCTESFVRRARTAGEAAVRDAEIIGILANRKGIRAAQAIADIGASPNADNDGAVAVLQVPAQATRHWQTLLRAALTWQNIGYLALIIAVIGLIALTTYSLFAPIRPPVAVKAPIQVGTRTDSGLSEAIYTGTEYLVGASSRIVSGDQLTIYTRRQTILSFENKPDALRATIGIGGDIVIHTENRIGITVEGAISETWIDRGCAAIRALPGGLRLVSCLSGQCVQIGNPLSTGIRIGYPLKPGKRTLISVASGDLEEIAIPVEDRESFRTLLGSERALCGLE